MTYPHNIRKVDIQGRFENRDLHNALSMFDTTPWGRTQQITHYLKTDTFGIIFFSYPDGADININADPLIIPVDPSNLRDTIYMFLESSNRSEEFSKIHPMPETDGSCELGFRIYNDDWETIVGFDYGVFAVEPAWLVFGK